MKRSVLIVDDEPLARRGVLLRLQAHDDLEVIGESTNGRDALEFIRERKPDLVFLDIQMPMMNGIDVVRSLEPESQPFIIFLTAFDQYVMRAFEVHAIDYLLKPVDEARFNASLDHARRVLGAQATANYNERLQTLLKKKDEPQQEPLRELAVRIGKQVRFVSIEDIDWIEAQGDYAEIHVGARTHLIRESLNTLEGRLNTTAFLRIHRSAIVRLNRIGSVSSLPNRDCSITLRNGTSLRVSRTYSDHLRKLLRNRTRSEAAS
ncbi:MAG: LytTR family DNA-binding domain-containing protein [Acidobacteriaceae bacterium]|nr:LytTR family DNA-binding domain-containing protein [Acidobacteriaceae bacterium]